jgi:hypothetical protein
MMHKYANAVNAGAARGPSLPAHRSSQAGCGAPGRSLRSIGTTNPEFPTMRHGLPVLLLLACGFLAAPARADAPVPDADALAERMLGAVGGREAWASLRNTVNDSLQFRLEEPFVVRAVIRMDFTQPRFRVDTTAPGLTLARVVDGERHWRLSRAGVVEDVPAEVLAEDRRWHAGHVYRTIHRVAARDPAIRLAVNDAGRLEIHESGKRIAWFALDARGEPYAFGAHDDDVGSISGPWSFVRDGIHHPTWVARPDGSWRAAVQALEINVELRDTDFARP